MPALCNSHPPKLASLSEHVYKIFLSTFKITGVAERAGKSTACNSNSVASRLVGLLSVCEASQNGHSDSSQTWANGHDQWSDNKWSGYSGGGGGCRLAAPCFRQHVGLVA